MTADPTTPPDQWTIRRVLDWTKAYLAEQGSDSPRLDAEILLAHARGCPRIQLYTNFDEVLSDEVRARMRDLVNRRARHEPVAFLVGHREFFSLEFEVNRDVLVPRPETEILVMESLEAIKGSNAPKVLDLGTGSGCIAVAVAVNAPTASVTGIDLSDAALAVARRNAERHKVSERVTFLHGDLFEPLPPSTSLPSPPSSPGEGRFDVIVSNPPYVATGDAAGLPPDVVQHEPKDALFAGDDGLDIIRRIVEQSPRFLNPGGTLLIEFSPEQAERVSGLLNESGSFGEVTILRDLSQNPRAVRAVKRSEGQSSVIDDT